MKPKYIAIKKDFPLTYISDDFTNEIHGKLYLLSKENLLPKIKPCNKFNERYSKTYNLSNIPEETLTKIEVLNSIINQMNEIINNKFTIPFPDFQKQLITLMLRFYKVAEAKRSLEMGIIIAKKIIPDFSISPEDLNNNT